jgi:hypothetical protein
MGHYAHITQDSIVDQVITAHADFIDTLPNKQEWIKTSYNTRGGIHYQPNTDIPSPTQEKSLRYNYAGITYIYDPVADAFYSPSPGPEYYLDTTTYTWKLIEE